MKTSTTGFSPREARAFRRELLIAVLVGWAAAVAATAQTPTYEIFHAFRNSGQMPAGGPTQSGLILANDDYFYGTTFSGGENGVGTVFRIDSAGHLTTIHSFAYADGANPLAGLMQASDGKLFGTTTRGGANNLGTIFKMDLGGNVTRIHSFDGTDGKDPRATVVEASDGNFYGTTSAGGSNYDSGTVFRISPSGTFTTLHNFNRYVDSFNPTAELIQAADGFLYGTTFGDPNSTPPPPSQRGTIFRVDSDGEVTTIHTFLGPDGQNPDAALMQASDGNLYGTTYAGGAYGPGTAFRIDPVGELTTFHSFTQAEGTLPRSALIQGANGDLYGTTWGSWGSEDYGTVFRLNAAGELSTLHTFSSTAGNPRCAPVTGSDGALYGTTNPMGLWGWPDPGSPLPGTIFKLQSTGEFATLHTFVWGDGSGPALIQAADGNFYGTTVAGGKNNLGTAFRLGPNGDYQILHDFAGPDGRIPTALLQADDGNLYGSTDRGGAEDIGTIFRLNVQGELTTMHEFHDDDDLHEGALPSALMQASDGELYGAAGWGGFGDLGPGTLFRIDLAGNFETFAFFSPVTDGLHPNGPLVESGGLLCGTTREGGSDGWGIVFCGGIVVDYSFNGFDGAVPLAGLFNDDGELFGTTSSGGTPGNGTIFKTIAGSYDLDIWHEFNPEEGGGSAAPLMRGNVGGQYGGIFGMTSGGGPRGAGTIFRVNGDHTVDTVHGFAGIDGSGANTPLIQGSDGFVYGASGGGPFGAGVVFRLTLSPIALNEISPTSGLASGGTALDLLGGGFSPSTAVTIGGVAAAEMTVADPTFLYLFTPALAPGSLNDVSVTISGGAAPATVTKVGAFFADFVDVPQTNPFHDFIEKIFRAGITAGCGGGSYCADDAVTRAQMAVFLLKAEHGSSYAPPPCTGVFGDVPCPSLFADWIEQLAAEGITAGCGGGNYCPSTPVTRAQMAVFLLKAEHGTGYAPPACTGLFGDVSCPSLFADWIEQLAAEGITAGCGGGNYCPGNSNTRGQMAVFLVKTFKL